MVRFCGQTKGTLFLIVLSVFARVLMLWNGHIEVEVCLGKRCEYIIVCTPRGLRRKSSGVLSQSTNRWTLQADSLVERQIGGEHRWEQGAPRHLHVLHMHFVRNQRMAALKFQSCSLSEDTPAHKARVTRQREGTLRQMESCYGLQWFIIPTTQKIIEINWTSNWHGRLLGTTKKYSDIVLIL